MSMLMDDDIKRRTASARASVMEILQDKTTAAEAADRSIWRAPGDRGLGK